MDGISPLFGGLSRICSPGSPGGRSQFREGCVHCILSFLPAQAGVDQLRSVADQITQTGVKALAKYILKRIGLALISMFIVITVVFLLMRQLPVDGYYGSRVDKLTDEQKQAILQDLGLLDPWYEQLGNFYQDQIGRAHV